MESAFAIYSKIKPKISKVGVRNGASKGKKVSFDLPKSKHDGIKKTKHTRGMKKKANANELKNKLNQQSNGFQQRGKVIDNGIKPKTVSPKHSQNQQKNVSPKHKKNQGINEIKQKSVPQQNKTSMRELKNQPLKNGINEMNVDSNLFKPNIQVIENKNKTIKDANEKVVVEQKQAKVKNKRKLEDEDIPQLIEFPLENSPNDGFFDDEFSTKGASLLKWLLFPIAPETFFNDYWETGPLHIKRDRGDYYKDILTTSDIDVMLREHPLYFGRNVDIVTYKEGKRVTENPVGRAKASIVLNAYSEGYSVRILNPHTYNHKVHLVLSTLQEYFGTMVGVNVYLTPAGSQGFAPHYDDIEAFVLQLEGRKHWKLYKSKNENDTLARFSSKDFDRSELGELMGEFTLNAGSVLYFPRGVVHEARTDDEMHSLHITISTHQKTAFADLLEKALPEALQRAAAVDIEFRKNLPLDYLKHLGRVNCDVKTKERKSMLNKAKELMVKLCDYVSLDDAADQMGKKFMHDALPPVLSLDEQQRTSRLDGERLYEGNLVNRSEIEPDTEIRLVRYYSIRLVYEENEYRVSYCTENAKVYHGEEEQFITIEDDLCPVIDVLLKTFPRYVKVDDLPHDDITKKISLVTELWDYGIIVTKERLEVTSDPLEDIYTDSESNDSDLGVEIK